MNNIIIASVFFAIILIGFIIVKINNSNPDERYKNYIPEKISNTHKREGDFLGMRKIVIILIGITVYPVIIIFLMLSKNNK